MVWNGWQSRQRAYVVCCKKTCGGWAYLDRGFSHCKRCNTKFPGVKGRGGQHEGSGSRNQQGDDNDDFIPNGEELQLLDTLIETCPMLKRAVTAVKQRLPLAKADPAVKPIDAWKQSQRAVGAAVGKVKEAESKVHAAQQRVSTLEENLVAARVALKEANAAMQKAVQAHKDAM